MKNQIWSVSLILIFSFLWTPSSKAAALQKLQPLNFYEWCGAACASFPEYANASQQEAPAFSTPPRKHKNPDDVYNSTLEGRIAIVCGLFPIAGLLAFSLTSYAFFLVPVVAFSVLAMIFGTIGIKRRKRGFAIAGFAMGFLLLLWGFALIAAL